MIHARGIDLRICKLYQVRFLFFRFLTGVVPALGVDDLVYEGDESKWEGLTRNEFHDIPQASPVSAGESH